MGCGCGGGRRPTKDKNGRTIVRIRNFTHDERVQFVELINQGATVKKIKKQMNLMVADINDNVYLLPYHRLALKRKAELDEMKDLQGTKIYERRQLEINEELNKKWKELTR